MRHSTNTKHMILNTDAARVRWPLHFSFAGVLLLAASCANPDPPPDEFTVLATEPTRTALFSVPNGFVGPVYLIWDPQCGLELSLTDRGILYPFDQRGILRIRGRHEWSMPNFTVMAFRQDGDQLYVRRKMISGGHHQYLPTAVWIVSESPGEGFDYPGDLQRAQEQLLARGIEDLEWTPVRRILRAADSPDRTESDPPATLPLHAGSDRPVPRFLVPDGFRGAIFAITDPWSGRQPVRNGEWLDFSFPRNGVLRIALSEEDSSTRSWPLVFEESGSQLWLRPLRRSVGFDSLPIAAFLVCESPEDLRGYEEHFSRSLAEQLKALGVGDLEWPTHQPLQ